MIKIHILNAVAGFIIVLSMGRMLLVGSNSLPYIVIALFLISYLLQIKKNFGRDVWIMITGLLIILSLGCSFAYVFCSVDKQKKPKKVALYIFNI